MRSKCATAFWWTSPANVHEGQPIALDMGAANVIWQGDANAQALALLDHCTAPPFVLNVTGPETVSVRRVAQTLGTPARQRTPFQRRGSAHRPSQQRR